MVAVPSGPGRFAACLLSRLEAAAHRIAEQLNRASGPVRLLLPMGGLSMIASLLTLGWVIDALLIGRILIQFIGQIVAVHMKGDLVDLQNSFLGVADHSVQVLTDSKVAFIPREDIKKLGFERPNVGMAMWHDTLVDGSIFREWIANVGRRDAHARIAHFLCEFSLRLKVAGLGRETDYELPMSQEQLADCVGLTPVHVNRTLKLLEGKGLISRDRRRISFPDWRAMRDFGDFNQRYLHMEPQASDAV